MKKILTFAMAVAMVLNISLVASHACESTDNGEYQIAPRITQELPPIGSTELPC